VVDAFLDNFSASGAGIGNWARIFLCNGQNATPDLRGRVLIGVTNGMGSTSLDSAVNPGIPGNPTYNLGSTHGSNSIILNTGQMPAHSHTATVSAVANHTHDFC
jgi:microcystin-dependent protein